MAKVTLKGLSHSYLKTQSSDADWAIRGVDIDWNDGGAYALLGPSGCGKTTLLNIIREKYCTDFSIPCYLWHDDSLW